MEKTTYSENKEYLISLTSCEHFATCNADFICRFCKDQKACSAVKAKIFLKEGKLILKQNTAIRYEPNGGVEVVRYKKTFDIEVKDELFHNNITVSDRSRLLEKTDKGYQIVKDSFKMINLYRSINNANKRAHQRFYSYCLANDWQYFLTLTFSPENVNDRNDPIELVEKWSIFQKWLKRRNPDAKIIVVPEPHEDGALHFHGFLSDCPNITLVPAFDKKTSKYIIDKYTGLPILNLSDWSYGFSTVAVIPKDNNNLRVTNYMNKYLSKNSDHEPGKKHYFHTRNLNMCQSDTYNFTDQEFEEVVQKYNLVKVKDSKGIVVYRYDN